MKSKWRAQIEENIPLTGLWRGRYGVLELLLSVGNNLLVLALRDLGPLLLLRRGELFKQLLIHSAADGSMLLLARGRLLNTFVEYGVNRGAMLWAPNVVGCLPPGKLELDAKEP